MVYRKKTEATKAVDKARNGRKRVTKVESSPEPSDESSAVEELDPVLALAESALRAKRVKTVPKGKEGVEGEELGKESQSQKTRAATFSGAAKNRPLSKPAARTPTMSPDITQGGAAAAGVIKGGPDHDKATLVEDAQPRKRRHGDEIDTPAKKPKNVEPTRMSPEIPVHNDFPPSHTAIAVKGAPPSWVEAQNHRYLYTISKHIEEQSKMMWTMQQYSKLIWEALKKEDHAGSYHYPPSTAVHFTPQDRLDHENTFATAPHKQSQSMYTTSFSPSGPSSSTGRFPDLPLSLRSLPPVPVPMTDAKGHMLPEPL